MSCTPAVVGRPNSRVRRWNALIQSAYTQPINSITRSFGQRTAAGIEALQLRMHAALPGLAGMESVITLKCAIDLLA